MRHASITCALALGLFVPATLARAAGGDSLYQAMRRDAARGCEEWSFERMRIAGAERLGPHAQERLLDGFYARCLTVELGAIDAIDDLRQTGAVTDETVRGCMQAVSRDERRTGQLYFSRVGTCLMVSRRR